MLDLCVIAVEFEDKRFSTTMERLNSMFFQKLRQYVEDASFGQATVRGKVHGTYRLSRTMAYYGSDNGMIDGDTSGIRTHRLVQDAIDKSDLDVNFEGYEYLIIIHSGEGQESTPDETNNIWSVAYLFGIWFRTQDRKNFDKAAIVPERQGRGADTLGVIVHEFLHLLGLPDLYGTGKDPRQGEAGRWDVMARGVWNGNPPGSRPAHPMAWSKIRIGWIAADQIRQVLAGDSITEYFGAIEAPERDIKAAKVPQPDGTYYLVEYRSQFYDPYIPDEGILITKVNEDTTRNQGLIGVVCARQGLNNATFKLGDYYLKRNEELLISVRFADNKLCGVDILRCRYATIKIEIPSFDTPFLLDGRPCTPFPERATEVFVTPKAYAISVPRFMIRGRSRMAFQGWSDGVKENGRTVRTDGNISLSTTYKEQALLTVGSVGITDVRYSGKVKIDRELYSVHDSLRIGVWVDLGATVSLSVVDHKVELGQDTRLVFRGWSGVGQSSLSFSVLVSQPTELTAVFKRQYYLQVRSQFGEPVGEGWYDEGEEVRFHVSSPQYTSPGERCVFDSWSGDYRGDKPTGELILNRPSKVSAQWKRQYLSSMRVIDFRGRYLDDTRVKVQVEAPNGTIFDGPPFRDIWLDADVWRIRGIWVMGVDVCSDDRTYIPSKEGLWVARAKAFDLVISVSTFLLMRGVPNARICLQLPFGQESTAFTNSSGIVAFSGLPSCRYELSVTKDDKILARATVDLVDDIHVRVRSEDSLESTVMVALTALAFILAAALMIRALKTKAWQRKDAHIQTLSQGLDQRVLDYVARNKGIISKSVASREIGISPETLDRTIGRLLDSGTLKRL